MSEDRRLGLPTLMLVIGVLLVALFFRSHDLREVPPGLQGDEMFNAWDASQVGPGHFPIFFPANFGREPLFIYLIALSTRLLGMSLWTVRLPGVLCGVAAVLFTYLLARRLHGFRVGLIAGALMAVSFWPVFASRVGLRAIALPAFQGAAMYALDRGVRGRNLTWAVGAGGLLGLLPYTYIPGQIFPLVAAAWLIILVLRVREGRGERMRLSLLTLGVALLVAAPFIVYSLRHTDAAYNRVQELDFELRQLMAGNPGPAWKSTRAVLGMFTWAGDPTWRYNLAGRPVFSWATGSFFYLGLLVSLWRMRRPAYALWLIWLPAMLLPAMVTGSAPSFWRSVGALPPVYVLPALGFDSVWGWVEGVSERWARVVPPLVAGLGLIAVGGYTWHDYFVVWPSSCEACHIYSSDLTAAARYLDSYEDPTAPAWISSEFAYDLSRVSFDVQSDYPRPVRWFNGTFGFPWPSPDHGQDVLILFLESCPAGPEAVEALDPYLVYQEDAPCGQPHLWVYRVPQGALSEMPWEPSQTLEGSFANGIEVLGYSTPDEAERGGLAPFVLYWQVPHQHGYAYEDPPRTFVRLEDDQGHTWSETTHFVAYPMQDWTPGDVFAERFEIPIPEDLPPQRMVFRVGQFTSAREIVFAHPTRGGIPLRVGSLEVTGRATQPPLWDGDSPMYGDLALLDASLQNRHVQAGGEVEVALKWQAMRAPAQDYDAWFELRVAGADEPDVVWEEGLWEEVYPVSTWESGEVIRSFHEVAVPREQTGGEYDVYVSLIEPEQTQPLPEPTRLGAVVVDSRPHTFELPAPEFPVNARFGERIRLLGYDLEVTEPVQGGEVTVTLYWQALGALDYDYTVFVHLYTPEGDGILGQHDGPPVNGTAPTSTWLPEEVIADTHTVAVGDAQDGAATLVVGLYLPDTGERLPVTVDGDLQPDNSFILTEIDVE